MQIIKKLKLVISILAVIIIVAPNANSAEECFERTSRAIFKFNMALDDIVLEPLAKGYNKLPSPITDWRELMQPTRDAARSLVKEGMIDVMQKGNIIGVDEEYRGPIRLRLCLDKMSWS